MQSIQDELDAMDLPVEVQIIGVNAVGMDSGNDDMSAGRDMPWLQDTIEENVWETWDAGYRDVILVDEFNREVDRFNVTSNDLSDPVAYAALRDLLVGMATD